ncbi:MAG: M14 family zinc carboxypeptidase [Bacteroidales bacterium]
MHIAYELLPHPSSMINPLMKSKVDIKSITDWDFYPTYEAYVDMMYQFASDYPDLCEVFSVGQSVEGREILFARISDNVGLEEGEAQFLYTATMHGDETAGFVLFLRLIDYLLSNYGSDEQVTRLVQNLDIWINPAANPDGTYAAGNNTVNGATRYNANWVDLNRNYPDPQDGPHPDGNEWQAETIVFMNLAENNHFTMAANVHGGAEVVNYPWDTWPQLHADDVWWQFVSREYADTVHVYAPAYYMNMFNNGITNGYQWYTTNGNRQDYMNYFHQCREFILEISDDKLLPASQLPAHWEYNYRSFLNYMEQALYGFNGTVTDSESGLPVRAQVFIENHDTDSSMVFSDPSTGKYFRPIYEGAYTLIVSASGYQSDTITQMTIENRQSKTMDSELVYTGAGLGENNNLHLFEVRPNPGNGIFLLISQTAEKISGTIEITSMNGSIVYQNDATFDAGDNSRLIDLRNQAKGFYLLRFNSHEGVFTKKITLQ